MEKPERPVNDTARVQDLRGYQWVDAETDHLFDHIAALASKICDVPSAVISIVDSDHQWFKAALGVNVRKTERDISFCGHAILGDDYFEVPDALADPRFADNPLVTAKNGVRFYGGMPIINKRGHALGTVCVIDTKPRHLTLSQREGLRQLRDMTLELLESRRRKIEALQYWTILNEMDAEIYFWDPVTTQIIYANEGALRNLQYSLDELQARTLLDIGPAYTEESLRDIVAHLDVTSHRATVSETLRRRRDGSIYPVEVRVQLVEFDGRRVCVSIVNDISQRKRIERMKADFISTVSHELRTPLTSIMGSLGLLKSGIAGQLPDPTSKLIDIAHSNSERLVRLINDILDIQKMEAGRLRFEEEHFALPAFVQQVLEANKGFADVHDVTLVIQAPDEGLMVYADKDRLAQVITNLLSNAIKFSPAGADVEVLVTRQGNYCRISVHDSGPGIAEAFREVVFEPFSQVDSSDARQKGGTGLGLHIAKAIVERLRGHIDFHSVVGEGTTFFVDLPLAQGDEQPVNDQFYGEMPRVLICESDQDTARLLAAMLEKEGGQAWIAKDKAAACALLAQHRFDAMTLDLELPDADGASFIAALRADPDTADLPIVVVSAYPEKGREQLLGGAVAIADWLEKPVSHSAMVAALNRAVGESGTVERILHVEDDPGICALVHEVLGSGVELVNAPNLEAARQALLKTPFDLVLLDIILGGESGLDLLPFLQTLPRSVPVVVFSAHELGNSLSHQVASALVKSRTSNEALKQTIVQVANRARRKLV